METILRKNTKTYNADLCDDLLYTDIMVAINTRILNLPSRFLMSYACMIYGSSLEAVPSKNLDKAPSIAPKRMNASVCMMIVLVCLLIVGMIIKSLLLV